MTASELPSLQRFSAASTSDDAPGAKQSGKAEEARSDVAKIFDLKAERLQHLVYKGNSMVFSYQPEDGASAVLKRIPLAESFKKELAAMQALTPHVKSSHSIAKLNAFDPNLNYLLMDPLGYCNLSHKDWSDPFSPDDLRNLFVDLLKGLELVHHLNWIHRDIRPENIILCQSSSPKLILIDFGLAVQGPTYKSNAFSGHLKFATEDHLEQRIKCEQADQTAEFQWDASTDRKALVLVALYILFYRGILDRIFEKYAEAAAVPNADPIIVKTALGRVLEVRKKLLVNLNLRV